MTSHSELIDLPAELDPAQARRLARAAFRRSGLTYAQLAERLGAPTVWTAAMLEGQHPLGAEQVQALAEALGIDSPLAGALCEIPTRTGVGSAVPVDPTIYRLYEIVQVYGGAIKALIHEQFGDGIMSAINFSVQVKRQAHPEGDRVQIILDGKFLPYQWTVS